MALQPRSPDPTRVPGGSSADAPYQPLAKSGYGNPFFYHQFADDFDNQLGAAGLYTISNSGAGTVAHAAGDGGLALFTTAGAAGNFESIQLPVGSVTLPLTGSNPPTTANSSKKLFYLTRLQLSDVTNSAFIAGLCIITATPFTGAGAARNVVDGLFFYKASGGTALLLINIASNAGSPSGAGFTNTFTIPTAAYSLVNATNIDLAFFIDGNQNLYAFVGSQLVGYLPQSGFGATDPLGSGVSVLPPLGPALANYNFQAQGGSAATPIMYSTVNMSPTLAVGTSAASAKTMTADFHCVQKER
jgi:hypothetical protein